MHSSRPAQGASPIHAPFPQNPFDKFVDCCKNGNIEQINVLLASDFSLAERKDAQTGNTGLIEACRSRKLAAVTLLIQAQASVLNACNKKGECALSILLDQLDLNDVDALLFEAIKLLVMQEVDRLDADREAVLARLAEACKDDSFTEEVRARTSNDLLEKGEYLDLQEKIKQKEFCTLPQVKELLIKLIGLYERTDCITNNEEHWTCIKLLIEKGLDLELTAEQKSAIVVICILNYHPDEYSFLENFIKNHAVDLNKECELPGAGRDTLPFVAAAQIEDEKERSKVSELLKANGANPGKRTSQQVLIGLLKTRLNNVDLRVETSDIQYAEASSYKWQNRPCPVHKG